jgi:large subunit ribosomal protein L29
LPIRQPTAHALIPSSRRATAIATEKDTTMSKPAELREQSSEQLELLLAETKQSLFRLRLQSETERLEAPSEIIKAKREIARIYTILRIREIDAEKKTAAAAAK